MTKAQFLISHLDAIAEKNGNDDDDDGNGKSQPPWMQKKNGNGNDGGNGDKEYDDKGNYKRNNMSKLNDKKKKMNANY